MRTTLTIESVKLLIKSALENAEKIGQVDYRHVESMNQEAINLMMNGKTKESLEQFLTALTMSGNIQELRGLCLINIGDWVRRIPGFLNLALEIFQDAGSLVKKKTSLSRLKSMEAMVYIFPTERGQDDPKGVQRNMEVLYEAIELARQAYKDEPEQALNTESLALHRLASTVVNFSTKDQWPQLKEEIKSFLPRLDQDSSEVARFNYALAMMTDESEQAARMLLESAVRMLHNNESLADAAYYFYLAAERYLKINKIAIARECFMQAEKFHLQEIFANTKWMLQRIKRLERALSQ